MSMSSIARAAADQQLRDRINSAIWKELAVDPDKQQSQFGQAMMLGNTQAMPQIYWQVAVDTETNYEVALLNGNGSPGYDETVISDEDVTTSVLAHWPPDAAKPKGTVM